MLLCLAHTLGFKPFLLALPETISVWVEHVCFIRQTTLPP